MTSKFLSAAVVVGLGLAMASPASATSIITNGDFSAGNTGFGSAYSYDEASCWADGAIAVVNGPSDCHSLWAAFGDHTTGTGKMMVVNGATAVGKVVWSQGVAVAPNTDYYFSAWVASSYALNPAQLRFSINGMSFGGLLTAAGSTGSWQQFYTPWNSGGSSTAIFSLVNENVEFGGNDFALDDISLQAVTTPVVTNPEPASLILLGTGLLGAVVSQLRRRRRS